jgi:hypothetical protein
MLTQLDVSLNNTRLRLLGDGARGRAEGLDQNDNPYPNESEDFDWWLFGWTYANLALLERN